METPPGPPTETPPGPPTEPIWPGSIAVASSPRRGRGRAIVAAALIAVLVVGAGAAYAYKSVLTFTFESAAYMPADTWFAGAITLRPGLFQTLSAASLVDAFTKQPGFDEAVKTVQKNADPNLAPDRQQEIALLDGEISFAGYGPLTSPSVIVLFHTSDAEKFVRLSAASQKLSEPKDRYKSGTTFQFKSGRQDYVFLSGPKGWVVLATSRSAAEQAYDRIDTGGPSLASDPRYASVIERLPSDRLGHLYFDGRAILNEPNFKRSLETLPRETRDRIEPLSARMAMSVQAASDGFEIRWESIPDKPLTGQTAPTGNTLIALDRLPADTLFALGGNDLPGMTSGADTMLNDYYKSFLGPSAPKVEFQFAKWLEGEFAFGLGRGDLRLDRTNTVGSPDVLFAAKLKDPDATNAALGSLDRFLFAKNTTVQGYTLKQVGTGSSAFIYGVAGDWLYALTGARLDRLLPPKNGRTDGLTTAPNFGLIKRAVRQDGFVIYADLENGRRTIEDLLPASARKDYDAQTRVFLQPLRAFGGSLKNDLNGDVHGALFIAIKR